MNGEQLCQRHRVPHAVVLADLAFDVPDFVELRNERQGLSAEIDHRLESRGAGQLLLDLPSVLADASSRGQEVDRVHASLQPRDANCGGHDHQQAQGRQHSTAADDPASQPMALAGSHRTGRRCQGPGREQRQQRRYGTQPGDQGHDRTQGPGQSELADRADVADLQRGESDRGGQRGQAARLPRHPQHGPQRIGTVHRVAVVMDQVHRDGQGEDHHHHRQRAQDEVHLGATPRQHRQSQVDRPDGQAQDPAGQLPVAQSRVQQHQADGQRDQEELLVVLAAAEAIEFGDDHRGAGQLGILELRVGQFFSDRGHRADPVGKALGRQQCGDADQAVGAGGGRETFETAAGLVTLDTQVLHDRHQPVGTPADPDTGQCLDPLADRLDQFLVDRLGRLLARQPHQHQLLGPKSLLEPVIDPTRRCLLGQPRLDVVVRRQRLGGDEQVGKAQDQQSQHKSAVATKELGQHGTMSRKAVREVNR